MKLKDLIKDIQIGKEYLFDIAFLNPATMRLADLKLNDLILLKDLNTNTDCLAMCWPSASVDFSQISLNKSYISLCCIPIDQLVVCYKMPTKPTAASLISLEYSNGSNEFGIEEDASLVIAYLREAYLRKFVLIKQPLSAVYMGQKLIFKINDISAKDLNSNSHRQNNHESTDLTSNFETMNLNEKSVSFTDVDMKPAKLNEKQAKQLLIQPSSVGEIFQVNSKTQFSLKTEVPKNETINDLPEQIVQFKFSDIAGLDKEIELLKEFFIQPFNHSTLYKQIGLTYLLLLFYFLNFIFE